MLVAFNRAFNPFRVTTYWRGIRRHSQPVYAQTMPARYAFGNVQDREDVNTVHRFSLFAGVRQRPTHARTRRPDGPERSPLFANDRTCCFHRCFQGATR